MTSWPSWGIEPYPENDGLEITLANRTYRTPMEQGLARQRSMAATAFETMTVKFSLTPAQLEIFHTWRAGFLSGGSAWFYMPVFLDADYYECICRIVKDDVQPSRADGEWSLSLKLEYVPPATLSADELTAVIGAAGSALPAWPESALIAEPLNENYAIALPNTVMRSDIDFGSIDQSSPFANGPATVSASWPMSNDQFRIFRGWWRWRLAWGQRWFTCPVFVGANLRTLPVRFVGGSLTAARAGNSWTVSGKIETAYLLPADDTAAVLAVLGDSVFDVSNLLHRFLNVSYPGIFE